MTSPGTMLQLFGGVSQTIGRFRLVAVFAGAIAALALAATFVFGNLVERSRELAILRVIGWEEAQVRRELAAEMALQGLAAGLIALALLALGSGLLAHINVSLPASLSAENPSNFAAGGIQDRRQHHRAAGDADRVGLAVGPDACHRWCSASAAGGWRQIVSQRACGRRSGRDGSECSRSPFWVKSESKSLSHRSLLCHQ